MSSEIDELLAMVDEWKFQLYEKLKGLTPELEAVFWKRAQEKGLRLAIPKRKRTTKRRRSIRRVRNGSGHLLPPLTAFSRRRPAPLPRNLAGGQKTPPFPRQHQKGQKRIDHHLQTALVERSVLQLLVPARPGIATGNACPQLRRFRR